MADALRATALGHAGAGDGQPVRRLSANERRQQLFAVALELFADHGYRSTTMDDIAEAAGVTKPLVYQHFSSKRALYLELVESVSHELLLAIATATATAVGPRQQVEFGFAAYFRMVVTHEAAFRLLYGREDADDTELGDAMRQVEDAIAEAIDPLIDAGLEPEHRRFLAYAVVGMAEGASRQWLDRRSAAVQSGENGRGVALDHDGEAVQLAGRLADFAWAGLRSVHAD
jgi:AcrR family transcriptional regulator